MPLAPAGFRMVSYAMDQHGMDLIRAQHGLMAKVSRALGLTRAAVVKWPRVPAERLPEVERITGIPRHRLRPDICPPPGKGDT